VATRKRGGAIGGLLSVPQRLPDDEEEPAPSAAPAEAAPAASEPPPMAEVLSEAERVTTPAPAAPVDGPPEASRKGPPGTIRLNETAGRTLWEAYIEAKTRDPFLSYRQFASEVVGDGLAVRQRRQRRSG
jgi:hypothetical protein